MRFSKYFLISKILSFKWFRNSWDNSYMPYLFLIIMLSFTWDERKICSNIEKSQNIMIMIAVSIDSSASWRNDYWQKGILCRLSWFTDFVDAFLLTSAKIHLFKGKCHFHNVPSEVKQGQVFNHKGLSRQLLPKKQLFMVLICYCKHSRNLSVKFVSDMLSDSMRHLGPYYQIWPLARSQRMWVFSYIWN